MVDDSLWLAIIPYGMHELISGELISRELILWELISRDDPRKWAPKRSPTGLPL